MTRWMAAAVVGLYALAASSHPPEGPGGKDGPPPRRDEGGQVRAGGIQWFPTWEAGKAEAGRTGRPILFVTAAPHCAGVPGIW